MYEPPAVAVICQLGEIDKQGKSFDHLFFQLLIVLVPRLLRMVRDLGL